MNVPERAMAVLKAIAARYAVTVEELQGRSRNRHVCMARQQAYLELSEIRTIDGCRVYSASHIGRMFGRDHSTVFYGVEVARARKGTRVISGQHREAALAEEVLFHDAAIQHLKTRLQFHIGELDKINREIAACRVFRVVAA